MAEKMPLTSEDIRSERIACLRENFPEVFTEGKVHIDRLKEALGDEVATERERYGLSWAGKSEAIRNIQTPSVATLVPDREESVEFDATENLFIEGDNLEVLKLLQKSYHGQVKMIYIDPPYNTGNEFIYPDNFREGIEDYLRYSGQVSGDGIRLSTNTETGGRYHSKWLNMMYPRLFLARNLLREDGVIFVSIDDHEVHNLRMMMDELFGEENFIANIVWQKRYVSNVTAQWMSDMHDHILFYGKQRENVRVARIERTAEQLSDYKNPDEDPRGVWRAQDLFASKPYLAGQFTITTPAGKQVDPPPGRYWRCSEKQYNEWLKDKRIWFGKNGTRRPMLKAFLLESSQGTTPNTWWTFDFAGHNKEATLETKALFNGASPFDTPKPVKLFNHMLKLVTSEEDLILDFFAGSATTAHAVLSLNREDDGNRKFIMVQLPEKTDNPDYPTIADIGKERIRRVLRKLNDEENGKLRAEDEPPQVRGFKVFNLTSSNFKIWDSAGASEEPEDLAEQLRAFAENVRPDRSREDILYEILLKSGLPLTAEVEQLEVEGQEVFAVSGGLLMVCLEEHVDEELMRAVVEHEPERFVCLDTAFDGNDKLKTNTVLQMKDHGIEFRTV
jgi:adenine-specific DNA-methyltransferase